RVHRGAGLPPAVARPDEPAAGGLVRRAAAAGRMSAPRHRRQPMPPVHRRQPITSGSRSEMPRTVLVTGLTGVVGSALLPELAGHRILALTHSAEPPAGVTAVRGDLTRPRLGLSPAAHRDLVRQVEVVVHAAAVTDFAADPAAIAELNVTGTARVLDLAAAAGAAVHYVSTAFVARAGRSRADVRDAAANPAAYLASKRAAERLVREAGLPATILRPSVVLGHSRTGEIA